MKQFYFVIAILLLFNHAHSQIVQKENTNFKKVGDINRSGVQGAVPDVTLEASYQQDSTGAKDTIYAIRFNDVTMTSPIFSKGQPRRYVLYFHNAGSAIDQLYDMLLNVFTDKRYEARNYSTVITLGTKTMTIQRDIYATKPRIQCLVDDGMFTIRNIKELNRLFGKEKNSK